MVPQGEFVMAKAEKVLIEKAFAAAEAAMKAAVPVPMVVSQRANALDDSSPVVQSWHSAEGVCGFAWVKIKPARGKLVSELKAMKIGRPDPYNGGGYLVNMRSLSQSYERKMAGAEAFAKVLVEAGINAYSDGRLD